ncbi:MAG TPA: hypothetical protein VM261_12260 [Kofleriaceae bacterium]|nr:hypothetical protein [Kofleriaceae bacterium]
MFRALPVLLIVLAGSAATAEPATVPRAPTSPHVVYAPTAWLQPQGQLHVTLGASHRLAPSGTVAFGLGDVAELDVELTDRVVACPGCGEEQRDSENLFAASALFKMGAATSAARDWRLGAALGFRKTFATRTVTAGGRDAELEAAQLYVVSGLEWRGVAGVVDVSGGIELFDARHGDVRIAHTVERTVRPVAGLAWTPPPYPRTTMVVDVSWSPEVKDGPPRLGWVVGWGVRYQALGWGAIELVVRQREDETLGDSTVMVRVTGALKVGEKLGVGLR